MKDLFLQLLRPYADHASAVKYWTELQKMHTHPSRNYHNLSHLQDLYEKLLPHNAKIKDWEALLFALFYQDAIYSTTRSDNEAKSAAMAADRMQSIGVPESIVSRASAQILATKGHTVVADGDTNLFTDADLSILGSSHTRYREYAGQIRREYRLVPDFLYKPGRAKVLRHFLALPKIFKTEAFAEFEEAARRNLEGELSTLG